MKLVPVQEKVVPVACRADPRCKVACVACREGAERDPVWTLQVLGAVPVACRAGAEGNPRYL